MAYIALKPCRFAGQSFKIGETVPDEVLQPGTVKNLVKMQILTLAEGAAPDAQPVVDGPKTVSINVKADEGTLPLEVTENGLQAIFDVLTSNVDGAETIIEQMEDGDALILLHICDNRKTIKEAAEERAKAISTPEEDPEGAVNPEEDPEESEGEQ